MLSSGGCWGSQCHPRGAGVSSVAVVSPAGTQCQRRGRGVTHRDVVSPMGTWRHPQGRGVTHGDVVSPMGRWCHPWGQAVVSPMGMWCRPWGQAVVSPTGMRCHAWGPGNPGVVPWGRAGGRSVTLRDGGHRRCPPGLRWRLRCHPHPGDGVTLWGQTVSSVGTWPRPRRRHRETVGTRPRPCCHRGCHERSSSPVSPHRLQGAVPILAGVTRVPRALVLVPAGVTPWATGTCPCPCRHCGCRHGDLSLSPRVPSQ